jgi:hypothetical protein
MCAYIPLRRSPSPQKKSNEALMTEKQNTINQYVVFLADNQIESLKKIAKVRKITASKVIAEAIETQRYLMEQVTKGNTVIIESSDGSRKKLVLQGYE